MVRRSQFRPLSCRVESQIRSTTQISVVTRRQCGISALVSQTSFRGEASVDVAKMSAIFSRLEMPVARALLNFIYFLTASEEQRDLRSKSERQLPALVESRTRHLESLQSWAIIHQGYCLLYSRLLKEAAAHVDQVNQAV